MRARKIEYWLGLWTLIFFGATAALFLRNPDIGALKRASEEGLVLKASDQNGRLRVDWDASAPSVRSAQGATLEVEDGGIINRYPVEPKVLRSGGFDYLRKSDDVLLKLTLFQGGKPGPQAVIRNISSVKPAASEMQAQVSSKPARRPAGVQRRARSRR